MPRPSLHRRILPWVFIVTFLVVAPIVVFYTSGYRWNAKKGKVERSSTVIIDSTPRGAAIDIDGRSSGEKTPVTIQSMSPGTHRISLSKEGYFPWSKSLDIRPELVTFANDIQLWKTATPERTDQTPATTVSISPDERTVLRIQPDARMATVTNGTNTNVITITFLKPLPSDFHVLWSESGRYAYLEPLTASETPWLIDTRASAPTELTPGRYRWEGARLVGNDGAHLTTIQMPQLSITRVALGAGILDKTEIASLQTATSTDQPVYVLADQPDRGLVLPPGNWTLWSHTGSYTMLRDGTHWLALQDRASQPTYHLATGDILRAIPSNSIFSFNPLASKKPDQFLLINGEELWLWNPLTDPQLLLRESNRIVNAGWHHEGNDIFFATETGIFALNLDPRDGYLTTQLATFDHVTDMSASGPNILIAGTKDGQSGIWTLQIE